MKAATNINESTINPTIKSLVDNQPQKISSIRGMTAKWSSTFVSRDKISEFTGGAYSSGYFANLDNQGKGVKGAFRLGRKICYPVNSVIEFLESREFPPDEYNRSARKTKNQ